MTLTPEQKAAAESTAQEVAVMAGPGTGKTRTLIARIEYLLAKGVPASEIVAVTFTNRAADEIKDRLGDRAQGMRFVGTLHSWMLAEWQACRFLGYSPTVISEDTSEWIIEEVAKEVSGADKLRRREWETAKREFRPYLPTSFEDKSQVLMRNYYHRLTAEKLMDYDGLITFGLAMYGKIPPFQHLIVDEYQDATEAEHDLYRAVPALNRWVVGDPDQSVYGWRGASGGWLQTWAQTAETHRLTVGHRCPKVIAEAASRLISHNHDHIPDGLSGTEEESSISVNRFDTREKELQILTYYLARTAELSPHKSLAILCRTNREKAEVIDRLKQDGIPVKAGPTKIDPLLLAVLEWRANPDNNLIAKRLLTLLHGPITAQRAAEQAAKSGRSITEGSTLWESMLNLPLREWLESFNIAPAQVEIAVTTAEKLELSDWRGLLMRLQEDLQEPQEGTGVEVLTIHAAKGREWDYVFLPGWADELFPGHSGDEEESRRVAYVAITRARKGVLISWPGEVNQWGKLKNLSPSRFIAEAGL